MVWKHLEYRIKFVFELLASNGFKEKILRAIPFWLAALLTGFVAVVYTKLFAFSENLLREAICWNKSSIFILAPIFFLLGWFTVKLIAPNAKGSGIPQVMAAIDLVSRREKEKVPFLLGFKILLSKIISSLFMVLGGGAIGREGPTIQISGSIFYLVNRYIPAAWPKLSQRSYIVTGAAAGLAAAFNTPLGGIVFAIEELAKVHFSLFRTALFTSVIIAGLTAQAMLGPYLYLGRPDVYNSHPFIFLWVLFVSVLTGCIASFWSTLILKIGAWKVRLDIKKTIFFVVSIGLGMGVVSYYLNEQILGSGKELINECLFGQSKHVTWDTMICRLLGPMLSFNVGAAGGIFAPSLAAGASIGAYISSLFHILGADANILILCGMVSFLTGVTKSPFTSAILVLEMTDRHNLIFYLMLAALVSHLASFVVNKNSLYDQLKREYLE